MIPLQIQLTMATPMRVRTERLLLQSPPMQIIEYTAVCFLLPPASSSSLRGMSFYYQHSLHSMCNEGKWRRRRSHTHTHTHAQLGIIFCPFWQQRREINTSGSSKSRKEKKIENKARAENEVAVEVRTKWTQPECPTV